MNHCVTATAIALLCLFVPFAAGGEGLSHLDAHRSAAPPPKLIEPLGDESLTSIVKGYDVESEARLAAALLELGLHSRLLKVGVADNGVLTAGIVKLQAGDRRSGLFSVEAVEADAGRAVRAAFGVLPELGHLDLWVTVPWLREGEAVHRPVFSLSVSRRQIADCLAEPETAQPVLERCGGIRLGPEFTNYAIDGPESGEVHQRCDLLVDPALESVWIQFGAQARESGELDGLVRGQPVPAVVRGPSLGDRMAITIDDGPRPLITPLILDILRREGVKATFFLVGEKVEQYPELARMIAREGHELGNHSYSHIRLAELNPRGAWTQVRGCEVAVQRVTGRSMRWFRPPGGAADDLALQVISALGYTTTLWTDNTGDWSGIGSEEIAANGLRSLRAGGVLLMHEGNLNDVEALPELLRGIRDRGLEPVTLSELVGDEVPEPVEPSDLIRVMTYSRVD